MLDLREFKNVPIPCYLVTRSGEIARLDKIDEHNNTPEYNRGEAFRSLGHSNVELDAEHVSGPDQDLCGCWFFNPAYENTFVFGREQFNDEWCRRRDIVGVILEEDWKGPNNMNVRILRPGGIYD